MKLTKREFRNEYAYGVTMGLVKIMLRKRMISFRDYWRTNRKMKAKYKPVTDGLISENDLLCVRNRALMGAGKEVRKP